MFARHGCPVGPPLDCGRWWSCVVESFGAHPRDHTLYVVAAPSGPYFCNGNGSSATTCPIERAILSRSGIQYPNFAPGRAILTHDTPASRLLGEAEVSVGTAHSERDSDRPRTYQIAPYAVSVEKRPGMEGAVRVSIAQPSWIWANPLRMRRAILEIRLLHNVRAVMKSARNIRLLAISVAHFFQIRMAMALAKPHLTSAMWRIRRTDVARR